MEFSGVCSGVLGLFCGFCVMDYGLGGCCVCFCGVSRVGIFFIGGVDCELLCFFFIGFVLGLKWEEGLCVYVFMVLV